MKEWVLEKSVDINGWDMKKGWTGLHYASKKGHVKIVDFLIRNGADLRKWSRKNTSLRGSRFKRGRTTALTLASRHSRLDVMKMLIENILV